jgi:hypothetical protein
MQWEYKIITLAATGFWLGGNLDAERFNDMMNDLGDDQWELVSVFDTSKGSGTTRDVIAVFKRPK